MNSLYGYGGPSRMQTGMAQPRMSTPMLGAPQQAQPSPIRQQIAQMMSQRPQGQFALQRPPTRGTY